MTNSTSPPRRLLFVIDEDFGALGTVMYLLHRQPLAAHATLLLPRRAYELHGAGLPVASRPYQSVQDILEIVETVSPDVVCLFSGYLFVSQGLLSVGDLRMLVRTLLRRGCSVATSDPYVGTFRHFPEVEFPTKPGALQRHIKVLTRFLNRMMVERHVRAVANILEDLPHIYPVPVDLPEGGAGPRRISFFNPSYIRSEAELRENSASVPALSKDSPGVPRWLFVIARFDLEFQQRKYGRQGFVDLVAGKLREALDNGRHPTFIGPAEVVEGLSRQFARQPGVSLLGYCPFVEFEQRLLDAEAVFYWQLFSTSSFLRLWNGLPVFFFDRGHGARLLERLYQESMKLYYMGGSPIHLDVEAPLDAGKLEALGHAYRQSAEESRRRLARLPTPAQMIETILVR
ncbi:MAG TPA: hypothetical protein VN598_08775 [Usitatibacter sp.]|nr:hypothetical protein [Usitatibacter sp.]